MVLPIPHAHKRTDGKGSSIDRINTHTVYSISQSQELYLEYGGCHTVLFAFRLCGLCESRGNHEICLVVCLFSWDFVSFVLDNDVALATPRKVPPNQAETYLYNPVSTTLYKCE